MTTSKYISVAIIGCGLIGSEWDIEFSPERPPLTHARAFSQHPRVRLVAFCDRDEQKALRASKLWKASHYYTNPKELFAKHDIDVAVISTSTAVRSTVIEPALDAGIKTLVIEKPLANTLEESSRLVAAMDAAGTRSVLNYSRHWDPSMRHIRDRITTGVMGRIQRIVAFYGKGLSNNGSHLIDLAGLLCSACPVRARALNSPLAPCEADWSSTSDRAWDAQVEFVDGSNTRYNLMLIGTDHRDFTCFELRIIGQRALLDLSLGGRSLVWTDLKSDPHFPGYTVLGKRTSLESRYLESMQQMVDEVVSLSLGDISKASCDAHVALRTAMTVQAIKTSAMNDGQWIQLHSLKQDKL